MKTKIIQYADIQRAIKDLTAYKKPLNLFMAREQSFHDEDVITVEGFSDRLNGRNSELRDAVLYALRNSEIENRITQYATEYLKKKAEEVRPLSLEEAQETVKKLQA